ncbi:MAG TPA: response regulator [bacterium]|nr:response regulator [bacterium]
MKQHNDFRILIAEDDAAIRKLYEKTFKQEGYEVVVVQAGSEILAELAEQSFDLLITDLKLEHTSALEILPEVRKIHSRMPVIVVSGYYSNMVEDFHGKGFNVNLFLSKPLTLTDLKMAVRRVLGLPVANTTVA